MPRSMSAGAVVAMMAPQTGFLFCIAAVIDHEDLDSPLRITDNGEDISVDGEIYSAVGFSVTFPEDREEGFGRARIIMNNVSQWLTPTMRALNGEFSITFSIVSATDETADPPEFDTVEQTWAAMTLTDIQYDARQVRGTLSYETEQSKAFPAHCMTPSRFPGL